MAEKNQNDIARAWRDLFEKGLSALQRQNLDYALSIFNQILAKEPGYFECREALRVTQVKKAQAGQSFFKKAFGMASSGPILTKGRLALRNNPLEALQTAEQILNGDPFNSMAHNLLADAALAADLPRTAVLSLEILYKNAPNDRHLAMKLADVLVQVGQVDKAEAIYTGLLQADPDDNELTQALKNLSVRRTMQEGGYDSLAAGEGSYRDILKDKDQSVALEQAQREVKTDEVAANLIREYEARLAREPNNLRLLRLLADLYEQKGDLDRSLAYFHQLLAGQTGSDPALERTIAETQIKQFDQAMARLDPQAPDHAEQVARLQAERQAFQLTECQQRVNKYPNDLEIRFEMGQHYFQAGKISEAIQEFQKARANPHRHLSALSYLGQCFARRGMNDLAARTLQNALKEKAVFDDEKKELLYTLGSVLDRMGKKEEAIEKFKLIYEVDISYQDVAARVDAYYAAKT